VNVRIVRLVGAVALLGSVSAGCGSTAPDADSSGSASTLQSTPGESAASTPPTTAGPRVYVDDRGVSVEITSVERIIPLDGDIAEIVFALGMGDNVVATDLSATHPPEADALPQIGYQRALNAEPILAFEPTLLIGTDIAGPPGAIEELERVGVPVAIVPTPADASGPGTKIRAVAEVLGIPERGEELASAVESEIATVDPLDLATSPIGAPRVAMLYLRGEGTQLMFGEGTAIDWVIESTGAVDVADVIGVVGTAEISAEALTAAQPDVLLVTADGLASVGGIEGLLALPAVAGTPAAQQGAVLAYDAQLMLGNGPRTAEFLTTFTADLGALISRLAPGRDDPDKETP
jgi:iron complex transport system substrate-binding protein